MYQYQHNESTNPTHTVNTTGHWTLSLDTFTGHFHWTLSLDTAHCTLSLDTINHQGVQNSEYGSKPTTTLKTKTITYIESAKGVPISTQ